MQHNITLDHRFGKLTEDQRNALRHVYHEDRKRGWSVMDTRYYVNALVDHQAYHQERAS